MSFFSTAPFVPAKSGPLYLQLEQYLRGAIADGSLNEKDALPPERDMAELYGVSRLTIRKALAELEREGLLTRRRGSGTYISGNKSMDGSPLAFREDPVTQGQITHSVWTERVRDVATPDESMALGVRPGTEVYRLSRVRFKDVMPVAIEHTVLLTACLKSEALVEESIYSAMRASGTCPVRALQRLRAVSLEGGYADMLEVAPGSPGLFMERRGYLKNGQTAEVTRAWYRGDASDLISEVSVPHTLAPAILPFAV